MTRFMPMVLTAFLARVNPVSTIAKPTCMDITRNPAMSTHARLSDCSMSSLPDRGGRAARRWMAAAGPDQRCQSGQDGRDQERHGKPAGNAPPSSPSSGAREWIAGRHRRWIAQVMEQLGRRLVTIARIALDGLEHDGLERRVEPRHEVAGQPWLFVRLGAHHCQRIGAGEGQVAGDHLVEDGAEGVDVGARVAASTADLLRRDVVRRADRGREAEPGDPPCRFVQRDAEIDDLHQPRRGDQDVLRLEVAMHDSVLVHVLQRLADLLRDGERASGGQRMLLLHELAQALALHQLHRHVHPALVAGLEELDDVGVIEPLPDLLFALEALEENHVALELEVRDLERDGSAAGGVLRLEDRGHPAPGDELGDLVLIELVADGYFAHRATGKWEDTSSGLSHPGTGPAIVEGPR